MRSLTAITIFAFGLACAGCDGSSVKDPPPSASPAPIVAPAGVVSNWPLFRGNAAGQGVAHTSLPAKPKLLWNFKPGDTTFEATAIIEGDTVYVGDGDRAFYALALADGNVRWQAPADQGFTAAAAYSDGRVFVGGAAGVFHCFDAKNGREIWNHPTAGEINSSPNLYEDSVLFGSQDGSLYRLRAADGKLIWKYSIKAEGGIQSSPTLSDHHVLFAGCDGNLHVIDVRTGTHLSSLNLRDPTLSSAAIRGDKAFFGTEGGNFLGVDWRQSAILWTYRNPRNDSGYRSSAAVTPGLIVIAGRSKAIEGLNPADGTRKWTHNTGGRVDSSPVVAGQTVYAGSADGRIYGLSLETGRVEWKQDTGGSFSASPAIAQGRLVIGNENGTLYCFGTVVK